MRTAVDDAAVLGSPKSLKVCITVNASLLSGGEGNTSVTISLGKVGNGETTAIAAESRGMNSPL